MQRNVCEGIEVVFMRTRARIHTHTHTPQANKQWTNLPLETRQHTHTHTHGGVSIYHVSMSTSFIALTNINPLPHLPYIYFYLFLSCIQGVTYRCQTEERNDDSVWLGSSWQGLDGTACTYARPCWGPKTTSGRCGLMTWEHLMMRRKDTGMDVFNFLYQEEWLDGDTTTRLAG